MRNLNEILKNSKQYLNQGNFKMASVEVSRGIEICKGYHQQLNEEVNPNWVSSKGKYGRSYLNLNENADALKNVKKKSYILVKFNKV